MSMSTLLAKMPKPLREGLTNNYMYDGCFTTARKTVVKESHESLVSDGIKRMISDRQELLVLNYGAVTQNTTALLRDIEVLRYFLTQTEK